MATANDEKIKNIQHILKHLTANHINEKDHYGKAWYCGDKDVFIRRHNKSIAFMRDLLSKFAESNPADQRAGLAGSDESRC